MKLSSGDTCVVTGLKNRADLNGKHVELQQWNNEQERWEVIYFHKDGRREGLRVRPQNLESIERQSTPTKKTKSKEAKPSTKKTKSKDAKPSTKKTKSKEAKPNPMPMITDMLEQLVRGGETASILFENSNDDIACSGQISDIVFVSAASLAKEIYGKEADAFILSVLLDYIGKEGDSELVQDILKTKVMRSFDTPGIRLPFHFHVAQLVNDRFSPEGIGSFMADLRKGTLAVIKKRQSMLEIFETRLKGFKLISDRLDPGVVMRTMLGSPLHCSDDNRSMKLTSLASELQHEVMCGKVTVVSKSGMKRIEVDESWHRVYIRWLLEDVVHTISASDSMEGSLGKFHRLEMWEQELVASIQITRNRIRLDVSEDFEPHLWIKNFVTANLTVLNDAPGVDTDRRILRLIFFAEFAWNFAVRSGALDKNNENDRLSQQTAEGEPIRAEDPKSTMPDKTSEKKEKKLKKGRNVVIQGEKGKLPRSVTIGMKGVVVQEEDDDHYSVSFSNLSQNQIVHKSNLKRASKMTREYQECICGAESEFVCSKCGIMWYCSVDCQMKDINRHKISCEAASSNEVTNFDRLCKKMSKLEACDDGKKN